MALPHDLAQRVHQELVRLKVPKRPSRKLLAEVFDAVFFASLKRDESQPVLFEVVWIDPNNPDPRPPQRIRPPRWKFYPLGDEIPLTVESLVKIARATDGRTSSLGVFGVTSGDIRIVGLVDEGTGHSRQRDLDLSFGPPGLIRISAIDVGRLTVHRGLHTIAELNGNQLLGPTLRVFDSGLVQARLMEGFGSLIDSIVNEMAASDIPAPFSDEDEDLLWRYSLGDDWVDDIRRLLIRVRGFRHGGAILFTRTIDSASLNIKYHLDYRRMRESFVHRAVCQTHRNLMYERSWGALSFDDADLGPQPTIGDFMTATVAENDLDDCKKEVDGLLWFLALLTRVDGLLLFDPELNVHGFGVEIREDRPPSRVLRALDEDAVEVEEMDYQRWGTRHRSMMRYCARNDDALGFVVSQDGDLRAFTGRGGEVLIWDRVAVQYEPPPSTPNETTRPQVRRNSPVAES
jgi:hypothetical protein